MDDFFQHEVKNGSHEQGEILRNLQQDPRFTDP